MVHFYSFNRLLFLTYPFNWRLKTCLCSRTGRNDEDLSDAAQGLRRFGLLTPSLAQHGNADQQEEEGEAGQQIAGKGLRLQGCRQVPILHRSALQFVADGVFYAELNELLTRELAEHGYSGVEVRVTPIRTEIIIRATRTQNVLGEHLASLA